MKMENWNDLPLIADNTLRYYLNRRAYDTNDGTIDRYYEAIVLNDDHLRMWNIDLNEDDTLTRRLAYLKGDEGNSTSGRESRSIGGKESVFRVNGKLIGRIAPELDARTIYHRVGDIIAARGANGNDNSIDGPEEISDTRNSRLERAEKFFRAINNTNDFGASFIDASGKSISEYGRDAASDNRYMRIMRSRDVREVLRLYPNIRLLLLDQYEIFTDVSYRTFRNLHFAFTGAPCDGNGKLRETFWQRIDELKGRTEFNGINCTLGNVGKTSRRCNRIWLHYVPNEDFIIRGNRRADIRLIDIHLDNANDTLVWRNLMATFLDNEKIGLKTLRVTLNDDKRTDASVSTLARMRSIARNFKLLIDLHYETSINRDGSRNTLKLRLKRFAAFFMKVEELRKKMIFAPQIFWTMRDQTILRDIYESIFEETIKGYIFDIPNYDRFLDVTLLHPIKLYERKEIAKRIPRNFSDTLMRAQSCPRELYEVAQEISAIEPSKLNAIERDNDDGDINDYNNDDDNDNDDGEDDEEGGYTTAAINNDDNDRVNLMRKRLRVNLLNDQMKRLKMDQIVVGSCHMKDGTREQIESDNVLGVIYNALFSRAIYDATTYRLISYREGGHPRPEVEAKVIARNGTTDNTTRNSGASTRDIIGGDNERAGNVASSEVTRPRRTPSSTSLTSKTHYYRDTYGTTYISRHVSGAPVYKLTNCEW